MVDDNRPISLCGCHDRLHVCMLAKQYQRKSGVPTSLAGEGELDGVAAGAAEGVNDDVCAASVGQMTGDLLRGD